jgi:hypothetical protein
MAATKSMMHEHKKESLRESGVNLRNMIINQHDLTTPFKRSPGVHADGGVRGDSRLDNASTDVHHGMGEGPRSWFPCAGTLTCSSIEDASNAHVELLDVR